MVRWQEEQQTIVLEPTPWGRMTRPLAAIVREYEAKKAAERAEAEAAILSASATHLGVDVREDGWMAMEGETL